MMMRTRKEVKCLLRQGKVQLPKQKLHFTDEEKIKDDGADDLKKKAVSFKKDVEKFKQDKEDDGSSTSTWGSDSESESSTSDDEGGYVSLRDKFLKKADKAESSEEKKKKEKKPKSKFQIKDKIILSCDLIFLFIFLQ